MFAEFLKDGFSTKRIEGVAEVKLHHPFLVGGDSLIFRDSPYGVNNCFDATENPDAKLFLKICTYRERA